MTLNNDKGNDKARVRTMKPMKIVMRRDFKSGNLDLDDGDLVAEVRCEHKIDIPWLADAIRNGIAGVEIEPEVVSEAK